MVTEEQKTALRKLDQRSHLKFRWILAYEQIGKVAPICRYMGVSRSTLYVWYQRYLSFGVNGLKDRSTRPHKILSRIPSDIRI